MRELGLVTPFPKAIADPVAFLRALRVGANAYICSEYVACCYAEMGLPLCRSAGRPVSRLGRGGCWVTTLPVY